jgi:hypothetical protein
VSAVGRFFQRLGTWIALAVALVVPLLLATSAEAALLPACEARDVITRMPAEWMPAAAVATADEPGAPAEDACTPQAGHEPGHDGSKAEEDWGDVRVAAMCDARGASVIAPARILPVADARIEAVPGCAADHSAPLAALRSGSRSSPVAAAAPALVEHAVLDVADLVPPASSELGPPFPPVRGGPRSGVAPGIDHPPR